MTLQDRLRECFQPVEDAFPQSDGAMLAIEAADALDAKDERIRELVAALEYWLPDESMLNEGYSQQAQDAWNKHIDILQRAREALK